MKIDIRGLRKVGSDKKATTFLTSKGHKLIVAHKALSNSGQKQISDLPHYDEGGGVSKDNTDSDISFPVGQATDDPVQVVSQAASNRDEQAGEFSEQTGQPRKFDAIEKPLGAKADEYKQEISQYPVPQDQKSLVPEVNRAPDAAQGPAMEPDPAGQDMPPASAIQDSMVSPDAAQEAGKDKQAADNYQKGFQDFHRENAQKLGQEDAAWQHDLQNGHVTPETYHDLFAKRDTLGKVGMLFGLLVSGMGSGLAHQSNAVIDGMNNEIQKDFEAQKQSKDNAQNFLKIHQQQNLNDAQIKNLGFQGKLTEAQTKSALAEADVNAQAATLMKMNRTALHNLVLQVQKMPPGPQRAQAEQALAMVGTAVDAKNFNIADMAASRAALAKMVGGGGNANTTLMKMIPGMEHVAEDIEKKTVPGVGRAQIPVPQESRDQISAQKQYDQKAKEYVEFAKKNSMNWANMNLVQRQKIANQGAAMGANLQSLYRNKIKGGVYKKGEQEFIQQIIPDQPASWSSSFKAIPKVEQTIHDNANDMQTTAGSVGLPIETGGPQEGTEHKSKSGKPMIFKGGKWHYK